MAVLGANGVTDGPFITSRAWVNFDGTTNAIRSNYNVSSVTRPATGKFTITFTTAIGNANYVVAGVTDRGASAQGSTLGIEPGTLASASFQVTTTRMAASSSALHDAVSNGVVVFR
jgi:hypothetical protein